jgi:WD40 repeat protein/energy-coupling factor transporter ATP-binding protein EcfA2
MNNALVRILITDEEPRQQVGAGFLVSPRHILTCAHVVAQALNLPKNTPTRPKNTLYLDFPLLTKRPLLKATVHQWYPVKDHAVMGEFEDICVLALSTETPLPNEARPIPIVVLEPEAFSERAVQMCGFSEHDCTWLNGTLQDTIAPGLVQIKIDDVRQRPLLPGFSGTAVWDKQENAVAGMMVSIEQRGIAKKAKKAKITANMISAASLVKAWPELDQYSSLLPNPYRGLQAFCEIDSDYFFGREPVIQALQKAVENQPFAAVIGASGSGKSSLVFAGLVPRLSQHNNWLIVQCRPQNQPFSELAKALVPFVYPKLNKSERRDKSNKFAEKLNQGQMSLSYLISLIFHKPEPQGKRLLLIIDQFEELYTLNTDEVQRRFLATLLQPVDLASQRRGGGLAPDFTLLFTMRSDFLWQALTHSRLAEALNTYHKAILGPMKKADLRAAIEKPAEKQGVTLETGLTDRILQELGEAPDDHLPLLEFALTQLWDRLEYWHLTHQAYNAVGGVNQALAHQADYFYNDLNNKEKTKLRGLMLQLVRSSDGTEDTCQVATRAHLGEDNWDLVNRLARVRLVVTGRNDDTGQETVELAHEALIRHWQPLRDWINEDRRFRVWQQDLRQALQAWEKADKNESLLLRGARLAEAELIEKECADELGTQEKDYIKASIALRERKIVTRQRARQERERLQRHVVVSLALCLVFALGLSALVGRQWQEVKLQKQTLENNTQPILEMKQQAEQTQAEAEQQRLKAIQAKGEAEQQRREAEKQIQRAEQAKNEARLSQSLALAALSQLETKSGNATNGILLALEALPKNMSAPDRPYLALAEKALYEAVFNLREHLVIEGHENPIRHAGFSPDGSKVVIVADNDNLVRLRDSKTGKLLVVLKGHEHHVNHAIFSQDGQRVLTSSKDGTARLWEAKTGKLLFVMEQNSVIRRAAFSPDGLNVVTTFEQGGAILWEADTGKLLKKMVPEEVSKSGPFDTVAFSPDGSKIATRGRNKAYLWNAKDGKLLYALAHQNTVANMAFGPDGTVVTASFDNTARLWDAKNGKLLYMLKHQNGVIHAALSPDGQRVVTVSEDYSARLWDSNTGKPISVPLRHYSIVTHAVFSPDGQYLVTTSFDKFVRVWNANNGNLLAVMQGHDFDVYQAAFSPDGQRILTASGDNTVRLWNLLITGNQIFQVLQEDKESVSHAAISLDGQRVVTISADKIARVWNAETGKLISVLQGDDVDRAAFSPDGERVITASGDNIARVWDAKTGKLVYELPHQDNWEVFQVAFSPDGQRIATMAYTRQKGVAVRNALFLWDALNVKVLKRLNKTVRYATFSPDGRYLVTAGGFLFKEALNLWDSNRGEFIGVLPKHQGFIYNMNFSPDGQRLVIAYGDKTARLWDIESREHVVVLEGHDSAVRHAVFSQDGQRVVTASSDRTARIWDANSGELVKVMRGHQGEAIYAAFSSDGQRVVTASTDGTAGLWDALSGKPVAVMKGDQGKITYAAFSPEGSKMVIVSNENRALVWRMFSTQELIDYANKIVPRCFTSELRKQFVLPDSESHLLINKGKALAEEGQIEAAIVEFKKAVKLEPCLKFDPEEKAILIAQFAVQELVEKGQRLAKDRRQITEALANYEKAQRIDASLITAKAWYTLCRVGSKEGYSAKVMEACNKAVELAPDRKLYRIGRGVTRAVTGNLQGAIADFQFFVERLDDSENKPKERKQQVLGWLETLRQGKNPFRPEEIKRLRFLDWW